MVYFTTLHLKTIKCFWDNYNIFSITMYCPTGGYRLSRLKIKTKIGTVGILTYYVASLDSENFVDSKNAAIIDRHKGIQNCCYFRSKVPEGQKQNKVW